MPYPAGHRERTRIKIIQSAGRLFNCMGFSNVTIDDVMNDANLTRGGFYNYFDSKQDLFIEVIQCGIMVLPSDIENSRKLFESLLKSYISEFHLNNEKTGCPLINFPEEAARGDSPLKEAYLEVALSIAKSLEGCLDIENREQISLATLAICVGAMTLAKGANNKAFSRNIRHASIEFILSSIGNAEHGKSNNS